MEPDGSVVGTVSFESARRIGGRDPLRPVRDAIIPLSQTPTLQPEDRLDDAAEWLAGKQGLVLRDGRLVGSLGPMDVERWYQRVVVGAAGGTAASAPEPTPPRPDR